MKLANPSHDGRRFRTSSREPRCRSPRRGDPEGVDAEVGAELLEVLVEVEDVDAGELRGDSDREVCEGEAVGAVGAVGGQLAPDSPAGWERRRTGGRRASRPCVRVA